MHTFCRLSKAIDSSFADCMHNYFVFCRLFAEKLHTLHRAIDSGSTDSMHTYSVFCRLFADLMNIKSVHCRIFADCMHTLCRANQCHSNVAARAAGAGWRPRASASCAKPS